MMTLNDLQRHLKGQTFRERMQSVCNTLRMLDDRYDWVGIYWVEDDQLVLGPWSGRQATEHVRIPIEQGICGAAVREGRTLIVDDVSRDPRYLSCFLETRSEIVVPIFSRGTIIGEIDVDGKTLAAFGAEDREVLEALAGWIGEEWPGSW